MDKALIAAAAVLGAAVITALTTWWREGGYRSRQRRLIRQEYELAQMLGTTTREGKVLEELARSRVVDYFRPRPDFTRPADEEMAMIIGANWAFLTIAGIAYLLISVDEPAWWQILAVPVVAAPGSFLGSYFWARVVPTVWSMIRKQ